MTDEDKAAIELYARTGARHDEIRARAIKAFRCYLLSSGPKAEWNLHMKFMSEVDTPCPDYSLRAMYRKQLLGAQP